MLHLFHFSSSKLTVRCANDVACVLAGADANQTPKTPNVYTIVSQKNAIFFFKKNQIATVPYSGTMQKKKGSWFLFMACVELLRPHWNLIGPKACCITAKIIFSYFLVQISKHSISEMEKVSKLSEQFLKIF